MVNEIFKEIDLARHVDDFFDTMGQVQQKLFISHRNELDAIAAAMHIQNATGNTTSISPYEAVGTVLEVLGAISAGAELATPLWVAMDVAGIVMTIQTSDSPTLDSTFSATYADLNDKFATMVDEIEKGLEVQSLEIRHSYQLMQLITQLTTGGGPWANPDLIGLESTSDEGFALWAYKQLLPTTYARYTVENCLWKNQNSFQGEPGCELSGAGPETIGGQDTNHTVTIVLQPTNPSDTGSPTTPCNTHESAARVNHCVFQVVPKEISTRLWGPVADTCQYVPGNPQTKWTFGCGLGVDKNFSVDMARGTANGWDFPSYCLDWQLYYPEKACSATTTTARANVGARGGLVLGGQFRLPRGFRVKDAAIPGNGLLYETAGPRAPIAATRGLTLRVVHTSARGARAALATPTRSGATLTLAPATRGRLSYSLAVGNVNVALPAACQARPASDSLSTPPVQLTTTILLTDGARTIPARLAGIWRCVRDRSGTITRLLPVPPPRLSRRPGLAVSVSGPRNVVPGHQTTYLIRVSNRRRGPRDRFASSLWHVLVYGSLRAGSATANRSLGPISRVTELRRGRSRTFRVTVTIPRAARGRACVSVGALADAARTAAARTCALVQSAQLRSRSSGLG